VKGGGRGEFSYIVYTHSRFLHPYFVSESTGIFKKHEQNEKCEPTIVNG
jgi:hypothetical protein